MGRQRSVFVLTATHSPAAAHAVPAAQLFQDASFRSGACESTPSAQFSVAPATHNLARTVLNTPSSRGPAGLCKSLLPADAGPDNPSRKHPDISGHERPRVRGPGEPLEAHGAREDAPGLCSHRSCASLSHPGSDTLGPGGNLLNYFKTHTGRESGPQVPGGAPAPGGHSPPAPAAGRYLR